MTCSHLFNEAGRISHKMWVIQRQIFVCVINIPAKLLGKCQFDNHSCSHEQKRPVHGIETVTRLCRSLPGVTKSTSGVWDSRFEFCINLIDRGAFKKCRPVKKTTQATRLLLIYTNYAPPPDRATATLPAHQVEPPAARHQADMKHDMHMKPIASRCTWSGSYRPGAHWITAPSAVASASPDPPPPPAWGLTASGVLIRGGGRWPTAAVPPQCTRERPGLAGQCAI